MLTCLRTNETFVAETFLFPRNKKCFRWFFSETLCFRNKCFPVCAPRKQCWLDSVVAYAVFPKLGMRKRLFSVKSFLVYLARKHCFPHVCTPKKHSGKQCFRSNVSVVSRYGICVSVLAWKRDWLSRYSIILSIPVVWKNYVDAPKEFILFH